MIVNTRRLFSYLLRMMKIDAICDVGSMNGADALKFREAVPESSIYAFEPNPENYRLMKSSRTLQERNIQVMPLAATNYDGEAEFFLVDADYSRCESRRGMSSLYKRSGEWSPPAGIARVKTTRLDTFLVGRCPPDARLALWIDAEGKAYEVIEGISGIAGRVHLLHVEVESLPCIDSNQKLYSEVAPLLQRLGFSELASDQAHSNPQFNAVFLRSDLSAGMRFRANAPLARARLRYLSGRLVRRACPACLRRYRALINRPGR